MTFTVPYGIITQVISSINSNALSSFDRGLFMGGLKNAYLWLAVLNALALIPILLSRKAGEKSHLKG